MPIAAWCCATSSASTRPSPPTIARWRSSRTYRGRRRARQRILSRWTVTPRRLRNTSAHWRWSRISPSASTIAAMRCRPGPPRRGARQLRTRAGAQARLHRGAQQSRQCAARAQSADEEALADYERRSPHKPFAFALVNRGSALRYLGRIDEALDSFDRPSRSIRKLPEAHWNKALLLPRARRFRTGWPGYEWRWRGATELTPRGFAQPQWRGEDFAGKTILLHAEQGYGDSIQILRYLPMVAKARGAQGRARIARQPDAADRTHATASSACSAAATRCRRSTCIAR